jgi:polyisoprenoid-binding protein YceI
MNKRFILALLCAGLFTTISCKKETAAEAEVTEPVEAKEVSRSSEKYTVDAINSKIDWVGSKPTGKHTGTINLTDGEIFLKDSIIETGKFTIDLKSITVTDLKAGDGKEDLENHLKGLGKEADADHFFNTNKYPTGLFEVTGTTSENGKAMVEGNLTLKGITKNIKFPATITVTENSITLVSDSFKINRTLWNINYSSKSMVENLGNQYINDDIELKVNVKANR